MEFGTLIPQFGGPLGNANKAPTAILLTNNYVGNNAANGTVVGYIIVTDPDEGQEHTVSISGPGATYLEVVGDELRVKASLGGAGATQDFTLTADDGLGGTYSAGFTLQITSPDSGDDGGLSDGGFVVDGGFTHGPYNSPTQGGSTFNGKSSGKAIFLRNVGTLIDNSKVSAVWTADFSGMKNLGQDCAVGFGWRDGSDNFHVIALKGDGAGNVRLAKIYGSANFSGSDAGWTFTDLGAPTYNGTLGSTFKLRVVVASNGSTYSVYTANTNYKGLDDWTLESSGQSPTPLANATSAATQFGLVLYTPKGDHGSFQIPVSWWREQHFEGALKTRNSVQSATAPTGWTDFQVNNSIYDPRGWFSTGTSYFADMNGYAGRYSAGGVQEYKSGGIDSDVVQAIVHDLDSYNWGAANHRPDYNTPNGVGRGIQAHSFPTHAMDAADGVRFRLEHNQQNDFGDGSLRNWAYAELKPKHWRGSLVKLDANEVITTWQSDIEFSWWDSAVYDMLNMWNGAGRFVCPASLSGRFFRAYANFDFDDSTADFLPYISAVSNGADGNLLFRQRTSSSGQNYTNLWSPPFRLYTNGYARIVHNHEVASQRTMTASERTWFGIELLDENFLGAMWRNNTGQALANNAETPFTTSTQIYDIGGWRLNNTTLRVPSGVTKAQAYGKFRADGIFGAYPYECVIRKNGSIVAGMGAHTSESTGNYNITSAMTAPVQVAQNDDFTFRSHIQAFGGVNTVNDVHQYHCVWAVEHSR